MEHVDQGAVPAALDVRCSHAACMRVKIATGRSPRCGPWRSSLGPVYSSWSATCRHSLHGYQRVGSRALPTCTRRV